MKTERKFWLGITVALVFVIIYLTQCRGNCPSSTTDLVQKKTVYDTVPVAVTDSTDWHVVAESKTSVAAPQVKKGVVFDSLYLPVDTSVILQDYNIYRQYSDTSLTKYGKVVVHNVVMNNRLQAQRVLTNFVIPEITRTETITVPQVKKNQLFLGINGGWQMPAKMLSVGPSLLLKTKRNQLYEIGARLNTAGQITYEGGMKFPISLK